MGDRVIYHLVKDEGSGSSVPGPSNIHCERARAVECGFTIEVCNERLTARYSALIKTDINLNYI